MVGVLLPNRGDDLMYLLFIERICISVFLTYSSRTEKVDAILHYTGG